MNAEKILDVCGNSCPQYVIRCRVALEKMKIGEMLRIIVSEKACHSVIPRLVKRNGCEVLEKERHQDDAFSFLVSKTADAIS